MRRRAAASVAMVVALAASACGQAGEPRVAPLRLAVPQWPGFDPLQLAEANGLFSSHGVDVEIVDQVSLSDAERAFSRGDVDGVAMTLGGSFALDASGRGYRSVLLLDHSDGAHVVIGSPGITGMEDLKGRTIGVEWAPLGTHIVTRALQKHGMSAEDVTMIYAAPDELPRMLSAGSVDAIETYAPFTEEPASEGRHVLFSSAEIPDEVTDVIAFGTDVLDERREDVERFAATWPDALALVERDRRSAIGTMSAREGMSHSGFTAAWQGIQMLPLSKQLGWMRDGGASAACHRIGAIVAQAGLAGPSALSSHCGLDPSILEALLR